ncbi:MAG TPA: SpoIIE family protein phosphatase [Candidatus Polarisedimenticolia bacterium]|nr:SpoIIE family protein phosphatase [Candidatus Polarisedimenticolia bacterium]
MDFLTIVNPDGSTSKFDLTRPNLKIGRSSASDLVLQDLNVSRLHAELIKRTEGYFVLDAGGKNGTFVNEKRIDQPTALKPGDRIRLGTTSLVFNGHPRSEVEFSDVPVAEGPGTIHLSVDDLKTPNIAGMSVIVGATSPPLSSKGKPIPDTPGTPPPMGLTSAALGIIFEADKELVFHRPLDELLEKIMDLAARAVRFERGLLMMREGETLNPHVVRVPPAETGRSISISRTIASRVIQKQESILTSDALFDERFKAGASVEIQQIRSLMCVPLWNNKDVIGLLYVDSRQKAGLFTLDDLRLLTHLANVAAVKIENARLFEQAVAAERMEQEIQKAAEIQNHLLPAEGPPIPGYEVFGTSLMCRAVGGDYYDYIELEAGRFGLGLGDVAGKGMPAALLMASFQASLRALAELGLGVDDTITRMNRVMCKTVPENRFVTFFYGILDPATHVLTYVNAGQCPPLLVRASGQAETLAQSGPPLGLMDISTYKPFTISLQPGDILVCYSDGVSEASSALTEEQFGEDRLAKVVHQGQSRGPTDIVRTITEAMATHCAGRAYQDDVTLVILKRGA